MAGYEPVDLVPVHMDTLVVWSYAEIDVASLFPLDAQRVAAHDSVMGLVG